MKSEARKAANRGPSRWVRADVLGWVADQVEQSTGVRPAVPQNEIRFITIDAVSEIVGLRKSAIYSMIAKGHFPRQVHLALGEKAAS